MRLIGAGRRPDEAQAGTMAVIGGDDWDEVSEDRGSDIAADALKGAAAGAAATWVMTQVTTWLYERESKEARRREDRARGGQSAYEVAATSAAAAVGVPLSVDARPVAASAVHWALGISAGAAYAVARRRWPAAARVGGLPFGAGFFLIVDEVMNPLFRLTPGPGAFPWQTHARGLLGHLAFGFVAEQTIRVLDRFTVREPAY